MNTQSPSAVSSQRVTVLFIGITVVASVLAIRAGTLQVIKDPRVERLAQRQFRSKVLVRPRRGLILDRNGEPLAINVEVQSLAANPTKIKRKKTMAWQLSKALGIPVSTLLKKLEDGKEFVWIKRKISDATLETFKKWRLMSAQDELSDGLWLVKESQRIYPHQEAAAQILGGVSIDSEGIEGVELWKNDVLEGKAVSVSAIKDAFGRPTFMDAEAAKSAQEGDSIHLTLDASLQYSVEQLLKETVDKARAKGGSVIVMNSMNGEILAMANQPSFNPNTRAEPVSHHRNRVVTDGYEPGSTLKPLLVAAALQKGRKLTDSVWGGRGKMKVQGREISEAESHEKFEWISLKKIIQVSSNVGAAKLALEIGGETYLKTLKAFGFGQKSGVGFPGEIGGWLPSTHKGLQPLSLATMGFGQGITATPLQVTRAYAALQNGGFLVQPTLLIEDPSRQKSHLYPRIIQQKHTEKVIETLLAVTSEGGTGKKAGVPGLTIAGKTGTSQVVDSKTRRYSRSHYIASFVGFAVGVDPKLTIFTSVDGPQGGYYAAETAAPLFAKVMQAVANRFSMPIERSIEKQIDTIKLAQAHPNAYQQIQAPAAVVVKAGQEVSSTEDKQMPSFLGMSSQDVLNWMQGRDFRVSMKGFGLVKRQMPLPGSKIQDGESITVYLGEP